MVDVLWCRRHVWEHEGIQHGIFICHITCREEPIEAGNDMFSWYQLVLNTTRNNVPFVIAHKLVCLTCGRLIISQPRVLPKAILTLHLLLYRGSSIVLLLCVKGSYTVDCTFSLENLIADHICMIIIIVINFTANNTIEKCIHHSPAFCWLGVQRMIQEHLSPAFQHQREGFFYRGCKEWHSHTEPANRL